MCVQTGQTLQTILDPEKYSEAQEPFAPIFHVACYVSIYDSSDVDNTAIPLNQIAIA